MRRLVPGHKLCAPTGEAGLRLCLFHQSGHDDLHVSVQPARTVMECSQPRRDLCHRFSFLAPCLTRASAHADRLIIRQMRGELKHLHIGSDALEMLRGSGSAGEKTSVADPPEQRPPPAEAQELALMPGRLFVTLVVGLTVECWLPKQAFRAARSACKGKTVQGQHRASLFSRSIGRVPYARTGIGFRKRPRYLCERCSAE